MWRLPLIVTYAALPGLPQTLIMLPLGSALLFWHREGLGMTPSLAGN
jgi:hypothetical protein